MRNRGWPSYVDWRSDYPSLRYEVIDLPEAVTTSLHRIMAELNRGYGAFGLVSGPDPEQADDPAWREALLAVPRHEFVPRYYEQEPPLPPAALRHDGPDSAWAARRWRVSLATAGHLT